MRLNDEFSAMEDVMTLAKKRAATKLKHCHPERPFAPILIIRTKSADMYALDLDVDFLSGLDDDVELATSITDLVVQTHGKAAALVTQAWTLAVDPADEFTIFKARTRGIENHPMAVETILVECSTRRLHQLSRGVVRGRSRSGTIEKWVDVVLHNPATMFVSALADGVSGRVDDPRIHIEQHLDDVPS